MRIPRDKIYRAFPELDCFSDGECELLMQRVRLDMGGNFISVGLALFSFILILIIFGIVLFFIDVPLYEQEISFFRVAIDLCLAMVGLGIPTIFALVTRDYVLREQLVSAIDRHINRIKCRNCKYMLIGQSVSGQRVLCPECGRSHTLEELGITEVDLIPPTGSVV